MAEKKVTVNVCRGEAKKGSKKGDSHRLQSGDEGWRWGVLRGRRERGKREKVTKKR